jgi:hypothetical protein
MSTEMVNGTKNPYLFIVGCPRSGTTLLRRVLDAHPSIAITKETHWVPAIFTDKEGLSPDGFVTPELIPKLLANPRFLRLGIPPQALMKLTESPEPIHYAKFVTDTFDLYGTLRNKPFVGDKTPGYVRQLSLLHNLWPTARFVHLIRDGRDVCLSAMDWKDKVQGFARRFPTWSEDPISTTALWWKWHVELGRQAGRSLGPKLYYEVRYESLVNNPSQECMALCWFLSVPYSDSLIRFHEGRTKAQPGLDAKKAWLPITSGLRDWRKQMRAQDLERFEAVAGDLLEELEYHRAVRRTRPAAQLHAVEVCDAFIRNAELKNQLLPENW